jgi:hypothetical protein
MKRVGDHKLSWGARICYLIIFALLLFAAFAMEGRP